MHFAPYLFFDGQCQAALDFYAATLGGRITFRHTYAEAPDGDKVPAEYAGRLMHATLEIGGQSFMAADAGPGQPVQPMSGFALSLGTDDLAQGQAWFEALAAGGQVTMPFAPTEVGRNP